jgi:hypothetical protein
MISRAFAVSIQHRTSFVQKASYTATSLTILDSVLHPGKQNSLPYQRWPRDLTIRMSQFWSTTKRPSSSRQLVDSRSVPYPVAYDGAWYGMLSLAVALLMLCALLAGLTLAVCGLNVTFLELRSVTGTPKQRHVSSDHSTGIIADNCKDNRLLSLLE